MNKPGNKPKATDANNPSRLFSDRSKNGPTANARDINVEVSPEFSTNPALDQQNNRTTGGKKAGKQVNVCTIL